MADDLAKHGIKGVEVMEDGLKVVDIDKLQLGPIYANRLRDLLTHLREEIEAKKILFSKYFNVTFKGKISMIGDEVAAAGAGSGLGKRKRLEVDLPELLRTWKLEDVADDLAKKGIKSIVVMEEAFKVAEIDKKQLGLIYANRLRNLRMHLHTTWQEKLANVEIVLKKMRAEPASAQVQRDGVQALCELVRKDQDNMTIIVGAWGIDVVVAAMTAHAGEADVLEQRFVVLVRLANTTKNTRAITEAGGINVVVAAMTTMIAHRSLWSFTYLISSTL